MIKKIRIPEERIPVLIGKGGRTKYRIQRLTHTKIDVGEETTLEGEAVDVMTAENIIKAIGRGFSPEASELLYKEDSTLDIIQLPKERKELNRIKSRLIGTGGKCRRNIENLTKTRISVFGRTVSVIGPYDNVRFAAEALQRLIKGDTHSFVYRFLEENQEKMNF